MKRDSKEIQRSIKTYNIVMSSIWQFITIVIIGILGGYLLEKNGNDSETNYMMFSVITSIIVGISVFFLTLIKGLNKIDKKSVKKDDETIIK